MSSPACNHARAELLAPEPAWPVVTILWMDSFFDVLSSGVVVDKHQMMDMMSKADPKPGTGA